ncbi:MAG TPA: flagellar hook capping FlgD N-terminal domain-containing protein [bacterium]|nr:flagellar hook capping FlgD N-terminal domain-containing protein [bacterium]
MQIMGANAYQYMSQGNSTSKSNDASALGKDQFLQLLSTQLRYQDPLNPMSNDQFIAQMAQFSSLEQMQNLNKTMTNYVQSSGSLGVLNLLGTSIDAEIVTTVQGNTTIEKVSGVVVSIDLSGSEPKLTTMQGKTVKLSEVKTTRVPNTAELQ